MIMNIQEEKEKQTYFKKTLKMETNIVFFFSMIYLFNYVYLDLSA